MNNASLDQQIVNVLVGSGPMQSYAIVLLFGEVSMRQVDAALRRLKRAGRIRLLKRKSGVRPFPLWEAAP